MPLPESPQSEIRRTRLAFALPLLLLLIAPHFAVAGAQREGIKGRYLEVARGIDLRSYRGAVLVLEPAQITADKDAPVDNEAVRTLADDKLRRHLSQTGLFGPLVSTVPLELPSHPLVRVTAKLTLQHGSQAMRYWVGMGAGKSKLHIRIDFVDLKSGVSLGYFNGYGTGAGVLSPSGGGIQRMAGDDLEESFAELAKQLKLRM